MKSAESGSNRETVIERRNTVFGKIFACSGVHDVAAAWAVFQQCSQRGADIRHLFGRVIEREADPDQPGKAAVIITPGLANVIR